MGEIASVRQLLAANGMRDQDIIPVINPPADDRDRSAYIDSKVLPGHATWRLGAGGTSTLGKALGPDQIIRSNHFKINENAIVGCVY